MNETPVSPVPQKDPYHTRAVIIAITLVALTCIISCAAVFITLILRTAH